MTQIILFQFPGACSRVTMTALEEIGLPYEDRLVDLRAEAQKKPDYLAVNPKGKVPALSIEGRVLTENAAILFYLHQRYPAAGLLPDTRDPLDAQQILADLVWCASTLHPMVRQIRNPIRWTTGEVEGIKADGTAKFTKECARLSERLASGRWWYGERWSILDVYLCWAYRTSEGGGFPLKDFPVLLNHDARLSARESYRRALAREQAALQA